MWENALVLKPSFLENLFHQTSKFFCVFPTNSLIAQIGVLPLNVSSGVLNHIISHDLHKKHVKRRLTYLIVSLHAPAPG